jgi:hypothetical protein
VLQPLKYKIKKKGKYKIEQTRLISSLISINEVKYGERFLAKFLRTSRTNGESSCTRRLFNLFILDVHNCT